MCGKYSYVIIFDPETMGSIRHLMNIFLGTYIYGSIALLTVPIGYLESKGGLSYSWFSGEENETSGGQPISKNRVEFIASELYFGNRFPRWKDLKNFLLFSTCLFFALRKRNLLLKRAPFTTSTTFSLPLLTRGSTFATSKHRVYG